MPIPIESGTHKIFAYPSTYTLTYLSNIPNYFLNLYEIFIIGILTNTKQVCYFYYREMGDMKIIHYLQRLERRSKGAGGQTIERNACGKSDMQMAKDDELFTEDISRATCPKCLANATRK